MLNHPGVTDWMMTGGCGTYDVIVWGSSPEEREKNKNSNTKKLEKTCHAELGAASPYVIVPGNWKESEIKAQAKILVGLKVFNGGHICASPQTIVVDRDWPLAGKFVDAIRYELDHLSGLAVYYPGTDKKLESVKQACPAAEAFKTKSTKENAMTVYFVPDMDAEG